MDNHLFEKRQVNDQEHLDTKIGSVACSFAKIRGDAVGDNAMVHSEVSIFGGFPCR